MEEHLTGNHFALALIRRPENGHMHWITIGDGDRHELWIHDSLKPEPLCASAPAFLRDMALSIILLKPSRAREPRPIWKLHIEGARDMTAAFQRHRKMDPD